MENNWRKNLAIIWASQFITMMGMNMVTPFLPLYIRELGITQINEIAKWSGFVFASAFLLSLFFVPLWGFLGDKYGRKKMLIRAVIGLGISQFFMAISLNVYHLIFARLMQGALSGFLPASIALVVTNTPKEKTGYALGIMQSATSAGTVFGPLLGGLLADTFGIRNVFFLVALICILDSFIIMLFVKEFVKTDNIKSKLKFLDNFKFVLNSKNIIIILICLTFSQIALSFIQPLFPLYVESLNVNTKYIGSLTGIMFGVVGLFIFTSAPIWGKLNDKSNPLRNLFIASIIVSFCYLAHYFLYDPYLILAVRSLLGIGLGGISPVLFTLISKFAPTERKGGILGYGSSAQILGNLIGPSISGIIVFYTSIRSAFLFSAAFALFVGIISQYKVKQSR